MNKKHRVKTIDKSGNTRVNKTIILGIIALALIVGSVVYILATTVSSAGLFDIDGVICADPSPSTLTDWGQCTGSSPHGLFNSAGGVIASHFGPGGVAAVFLRETTLLSSDPSVYVGSNKNNDPISSWIWGTGNNQAKDQLSDVYAYAAFAPTTSANITAGDFIIYAGAERISSSGDSHVDFEFFQAPVGLAQSVPCSFKNNTCTFSGTRTVGDIIVSLDYVVGGALGGISVHKWGGSSYLLVESVTRTANQFCNIVGSICASNNNATIATGPWGAFDSHGNFFNSTSQDCTVKTNPCIPVNGFTEFGIDITKELGSTPCFSSILPKTRSSQSFTATLQDFEGPAAFGVCHANISIAPNKTNEVGTPHTFTVTLTKTIGGFTSPVPNTPVTVTLTPLNGATPTVSSNTCASPGTNSNGQCTITFVSPTAGQVNGSATATVTIGTNSFPVTTNGLNGNSLPAVKTYVDARIQIAPTLATNEVNVTHTFTITAQQNLGLGASFVNVPDGTKPVVTLVATNGATITNKVNNCASSGTTSGLCTVTFTSTTGGTVTGNACLPSGFQISGVTLSSRCTGDGKTGDSGPAVKIFVDAFITVSPLTATNSIFDSHTFTFAVKEDTGTDGGYVNAPDGTIVSVTLTGSGGANPVPNTTSCTLSSGTCTVTFTSNTVGTVTIHGSVTLTVGGVSITRATGDNKSFDSPNAVKTFIAGSISWMKFDNNGALLAGSTFQVCRTANNHADGTSTPVSPAVCFSVTDNLAPDQNPTGGIFLLTGLRLGNYTIQETQAPPGFVIDPTVAQVSLTINSPNASITQPFIDQRPILKLSGFGYTNTMTGQNSTAVSGTVVYTLAFHNFGAAAGVMNFTFTVSFSGTGKLTCDSGSNTLSMTGVTVTAGGSRTFTFTCNYSAKSGSIITADLNATYNTAAGDTGIRTVNGCPAEIKFTVQAN